MGESGQQQRVLKEGGESGKHNGVLQFGSGRMVESGDRSTSSSGKVSGIATQKGRVVVIAGPTAVGKTRVALALAKQLGGEIISADSVQVGAKFHCCCSNLRAHQLPERSCCNIFCTGFMKPGSRRAKSRCSGVF